MKEQMNVCFFGGKAFLEVSENYLFYIGDAVFISSLSEAELRDLTESTMLEIKFGTKSMADGIHLAPSGMVN